MPHNFSKNLEFFWIFPRSFNFLIIYFFHKNLHKNLEFKTIFYVKEYKFQKKVNVKQLPSNIPKVLHIIVVNCLIIF